MRLTTLLVALLCGACAADDLPPIEGPSGQLGECTLCAADLDRDGDVDYDDLAVIQANFGQAGEDLVGDLDGDGEVQFGDFLILSDSYGEVCECVNETE